MFADRLSWRGSGTGSGTWDVATTSNFVNTSSSATSDFTAYDEVTFDDNTNPGDSPVAVTIAAGGVSPSKVIVNSSRNFVFSGGPITGGAQILKNGSGSNTGSLTLGSNSHTGGTTVTYGTLRLTSDSSLGAVPSSPTTSLTVTKTNATNITTLAFDASMTLDANRTIVIGQTAGGGGPIFDTGAFDVTINGRITGSTAVNLMKLGGSGTLFLRGDNSTNLGGNYVGALFVNVGTVNVVSDVNLGRTVANGNTMGINLNGGTLQFGASFPWASRAVAVGGPGGAVDAITGVDQTIDIGITGIGALTKTGPGSVTFSASSARTAATTVSAGTLGVGHVDALGTGAVAVNGSSVLKLQPGLPKAYDATPMTLAGGSSPTASLDITDGSAVIGSATLATHTLVNAQVKQAFNNFGWDQPGITSSTVAADIQNGTPTTLGILFNNDGGGNALFYGNGNDLPQFEGRSVDANTVLVKYTLLGDGDLSGSVDSVDFALFQAGFEGAAPYVGFAFGDYNYDGTVDSVDFGLFQAGFAASQPLSQPTLAAAIAEFAAANGLALGVTAVPEPATLGVLGVSALGLLARRRRA